MKKLSSILITAFAILFSGCGSGNNHCDMIWDLITPDVCIIVTNADGENLLDPDVEGNILNSGIKVEYNDETYPITSRTRETLAMWYGLRVEAYAFNDDTPALKFGEFSTDGYHGETFTIDWGNGKTSEVKFDLYVTWKKCRPIVHQRVWLDGTLMSGNSLTMKITR